MPIWPLSSPVRTTLVEVDEGGNALAFHSPQRYVQLLTPQVFTRAKFAELGAGGKELHPSQVTLVKGSPLNIRIGGAGEAGLAKSFLSAIVQDDIGAPVAALISRDAPNCPGGNHFCTDRLPISWNDVPLDRR